MSTQDILKLTEKDCQLQKLNFLEPVYRRSNWIINTPKDYLVFYFKDIVDNNQLFYYCMVDYKEYTLKYYYEKGSSFIPKKVNFEEIFEQLPLETQESIIFNLHLFQ